MVRDWLFPVACLHGLIAVTTAVRLVLVVGNEQRDVASSRRGVERDQNKAQ